MRQSAPISVALTIDDAPSACEPGGPDLDPLRMDRIRELVLAAGIRHCVAFVIGARARGHEGCLRRWLDAGFELGNHTEDHLAASSVEVDRFLQSARSCHQRLLDVGAFEGRRRFFRHPFGDRGGSVANRRAIAAGLAELGYSSAEVTTDLYDYAYDPAWTRAHERRPSRARRIEARWTKAAAASVARSERRGRPLFGPDFVQVAACHFGPVTERGLPGLIQRLGTGVRWVALAEAVDVPCYQQLVSDMSRAGSPSELLWRGLTDRVLRRAARLGRRIRVLDGSGLGPRWPHL